MSLFVPLLLPPSIQLCKARKTRQRMKSRCVLFKKEEALDTYSFTIISRQRKVVFLYDFHDTPNEAKHPVEALYTVLLFSHRFQSKSTP